MIVHLHFLLIHTQGTFLVCFLLSKKKSQSTPVTRLAYLLATVELTFTLNIFFFFSRWICSSANFTVLLLDVQPLPQEQKKLGRCQSVENLTPHTCPNTVAKKVSIQKLLFAGSALQRKLFLLWGKCKCVLLTRVVEFTERAAPKNISASKTASKRGGLAFDGFVSVLKPEQLKTKSPLLEKHCLPWDVQVKNLSLPRSFC